MIKRLRGTKDLIGEEAKAWHHVERVAHHVFDRFGFEPMRTPILEEAKLFMHSVGEVTDIVQKEMYQFEDRSKTHIALRPEGTAGVVRAYLENHLSKDRGIQKLYYTGPMFRAERPQAGRLRQFHQLGVEIIGTDAPYADIETMEVLVRFLEELGIGDFSIQINNLGNPQDRIKFSEALKKHLFPSQSKLCKDCQDRLDRNPMRVLDCKKPECQLVIEKAPTIQDFVSESSAAKYAAILSFLKGAKISFKENKRIVRGLDYYTDTVFELTHPKLGSQDALAAGGRYNGLIERLGGSPVPAVGFALGLERLMMVLSSDSASISNETRSNRVSVIGLGDGSKSHAYQITSDLRKMGIAAEMNFENKSLKSQLRQADKARSRFALILGDDEIKKGIVLLKDMQLSGRDAQAELSTDEAKQKIRKAVAV